MDAILQQLGQLLLRAVPTFLLVIILHFYLKFMFFKPLQKVLRQRYEATEGARKLAEESLARAAKKTAEYEAALREARAEVYQTQEQIHRELQEREASEIAEARRQTEATIQGAREALAQDVEAAKATLSQDSDKLAEQIAREILQGSAA